MKRLYVRETEAWSHACEQNRLSDRVLQVTELAGGIILPPEHWNPQTGEFQGGVCDRNFNFVAGLLRGKPPQAGFYGVGSAYPITEEELTYADEEVIFGGILIGHFGHFILECLGRLWYVLTRDEPCKRIAFLTELETCSWFWSFFDLLSIPKERILLLKSPTRFKSVTVPEESVHSWYKYSKEYLFPYRFMVEQAQKRMAGKSLWKKIFLTRRNLENSQTKCVNEEYFCKFFSAHGFIVVELETLPLPEQIAMVSQADEIAAVMGSLTHWALFCKPGTKFTMLTRTSNDILGSQCLINAASQVDWYIVDTAMNLFYANRAVGVCLIGPTIWWQEYVRDNYGVWQDDGSWQRVYHEYLREWTDYMLQPHKWEDIRKLDALSLLTRINKALHQNEMTVDRGSNMKPTARFLLAEEGAAYFWLEDECSLQCLDLNSGEVTVLYQSSVQEFPVPLYGCLVKAGTHLVLTPENGNNILDYDVITGQVLETALPQPLPRGNFRYALSYQGKVFMTGYQAERIICYNPLNQEVCTVLELPRLQNLDYSQHPPLGGKPCLLADKLYVPILNTNQVVELSLTNHSCIVHQVGAKEAAYGFAIAYADNIWLAPSQGGPMAVWNPPTGVMQVFAGFPQDFSFRKVDGRIRFFTDAIPCGPYLWLLPWGANQILRLDMESGSMAAVPAEAQKNPQEPCAYCGCASEDALLIWSGVDKKIHSLDKITGRELVAYKI